MVLYVVLVMAGALNVAVDSEGGLASVEMSVAYNADGRREAMAAAAGVVAKYGTQHRAATLIMAGAFPDDKPMPYVVAAVTDEPVSQALGIREIGEHPMRKHIMLALATVEHMRGESWGQVPIPVPYDAQLGSAPMQSVATALPASEDGTRLFAERRATSAKHHDAARRALDLEARRQRAAGDEDMAAYLMEARERVGVEAFHEVPAETAAASEPVSEAWMRMEPYFLTEPYKSDPLPSPKAQPDPPSDFHPTQREHLLYPQFFLDLESWFQGAIDWMLAVAEKRLVLPRRPLFFLRGQEVFYPEAKGLVWDCRGCESKGVIKPADFTAILPSKWDSEWLREQWAGYTDKEAVSHACDGADLKGDNMALQFCFSPHLESIADGYSEAYDDIVKLKQLGYYEWFKALAFCPCHLHGQGCRPKGLGWRRIASGGDPYEPVQDAEGILAYSINAATKLLYPSTTDNPVRRRWRVIGLTVLTALLMAKVIFTLPDLFRGRKRWRKERKPRVEHAMSDTVVMRSVGDFVGMPVFYFSDDFRHFFYQIRLAARCLWYTGILLLDVKSATLLFIVELGMAMGFTPCSNIAQSVGDAILWLFDQFMAAAEAAAGLEPCLKSIMHERARRHGARHGRPWNGRCYTDDILLVLIGVNRLVRAVVVWRTLLRKAGILGADVLKRQVGSQVLFLGVSLLATALVALVPEQKLARALVGLSNLLRGVLHKEATQKLLGLLVHLSFLSSTGRAVTAGMWRCLAEGRQDPVLLLASERPRVHAWLARLRRSPAVPMDVALRRRQRTRESPATMLATTGQSDAFAEHGPAIGGLGGFGAGTLWRADVYFTSIGPAE